MQSDWPLLGPLQWLRYVNKRVTVKTRTGEEIVGWLFTVDPVSASVVLVDFVEDGGALVQVVMGHAVEEVQVMQEADSTITERLQVMFLPPRTSILDPEELGRRKRGVRSILERNRVPLEEEGDELKVAGVLTIRPPYSPEDCYSPNEIILDRVQRLIRNQTDHPESS